MDDDLGTYDDSMISASFLDIDTLEDEYTVFIQPRKMMMVTMNIAIISIVIHLQKSLLSELSCNSSKCMGDDDAPSFSSQNSAWL